MSLLRQAFRFFLGGQLKPVEQLRASEALLGSSRRADISAGLPGFGEHLELSLNNPIINQAQPLPIFETNQGLDSKHNNNWHLYFCIYIRLHNGAFRLLRWPWQHGLCEYALSVLIFFTGY